MIVYTIGHGRHSFETLRAMVEAHGVTLLVDVRSEPTSRHAPDFRKAVLTGLAHEAGLGYRWMGRALGGRSRPGAAQFAAAVDEVAALAAGGPVALLCAETDPASCHRSLVLAPALEARGATVWHILPDGTAAPHQPPLGLEDPS